MDSLIKLIKNTFFSYVYSSYTFHMAAVGTAYILFILSKGNDFITNIYFGALVVMSLLSAGVLATITQLNYDEIRDNQSYKVISIFTYKNKITGGERVINTLISSTINIVILNILNYSLYYRNNIKPLLFVLLFVYIIFVFLQINALHRDAKKR